MKITDVRVRKVNDEGKMKAVVSVTFDSVATTFAPDFFPVPSTVNVTNWPTAILSIYFSVRSISLQPDRVVFEISQYCTYRALHLPIKSLHKVKR